MLSSPVGYRLVVVIVYNILGAKGSWAHHRQSTLLFAPPRANGGLGLEPSLLMIRLEIMIRSMISDVGKQIIFMILTLVD